MLNNLRTVLKIDIYEAVNSTIYSLRKLKIFNNIISYSAYKNKTVKKIVGLIALLLTTLKNIIFRLIYFLVLYLINYKLFNNNYKAFIYIFIICCIIGMLINNKLLITDNKKYTALVLFNINQKLYLRTLLNIELFNNFIFNLLIFIPIKHLLDIPIGIIIILLIFNMLTKIIGEASNILFYKKRNYLWQENSTLYFTSLIILLIIGFLPWIGIIPDIKCLLILSIIAFILGGVSLVYLLKINDYKLLFKNIREKNKMNSNNTSYKQELLSVKNKDIKISDRKLEGLTSYDKFNKIFFERHKNILLRSARNYSIIIGIILLVLNILTYNYIDIKEYTNIFLSNHIAWFILIMYFVNRGAIITQAMFYNCDHAMLKYNFYREPKVILSLFKKRITTVVKVNLLPAIVMVFGIGLLLIQNNFNILNIITISLFILLLNTFFSVHYLVIYYLFQPYNEQMQIKKVSYSILSLGVYIIAYSIRNVVVKPLLFSSVGLIITICYILLSLFLVYKFAYKTFKLN